MSAERAPSTAAARGGRAGGHRLTGLARIPNGDTRRAAPLTRLARAAEVQCEVEEVAR